METVIDVLLGVNVARCDVS